LSALVLDSEALSSLARNSVHERTVRAALAAAIREVAEVAVPAGWRSYLVGEGRR
jgi:hypothetical protein